jgi:hypothetical protein
MQTLLVVLQFQKELVNLVVQVAVEQVVEHVKVQTLDQEILPQ